MTIIFFNDFFSSGIMIRFNKIFHPDPSSFHVEQTLLKMDFFGTVPVPKIMVLASCDNNYFQICNTSSLNLSTSFLKCQQRVEIVKKKNQDLAGRNSTKSGSEKILKKSFRWRKNNSHKIPKSFRYRYWFIGLYSKNFAFFGTIPVPYFSR